MNLSQKYFIDFIDYIQGKMNICIMCVNMRSFCGSPSLNVCSKGRLAFNIDLLSRPEALAPPFTKYPRCYICWAFCTRRRSHTCWYVAHSQRDILGVRRSSSLVLPPQTWPSSSSCLHWSPWPSVVTLYTLSAATTTTTRTARWGRTARRKRGQR